MVQQFGLELLFLVDGWASGERETKQQTYLLKMALIAAGADPAEVLAQEPESYDDFDPASDEGVDFDYSAVNWQEGASADEWERLQEELDTTRVTVSSGQDEPVDSPEVPDVDFDREWQ